MANRSLSDIANDKPLDGKHICAVQREQKGAVQRETKDVNFNVVVDYGTTIAYSTVYGTVVATAAGTMITTSTLANH